MKKILIIRKQDDFSHILAENGFEVISLPLIATKISANLEDFEKRLDGIENYDGIFLTSSQAAEILKDKFSEKNINFSGKIYVLGKKSFDILKSENFDLHFDEKANTASEMLERLSIKSLRGRKFLFVCGGKSLRIVPEFLERIAKIEESIVYETGEISIAIDKISGLTEKFARNEIVAVCFFSPSQAESFIKQFGVKVLHQTKIATIGKTTADFFERQNLKVAFVSPKTTAKDFAESLIEHLEKENADH